MGRSCCHVFGFLYHRSHLLSEISFINRLSKKDLIDILKFRKCELLSNQMESNIRIFNLISKSLPGHLDYLLMIKLMYETPLVEENEVLPQEGILETSTIGLEDYNQPGGGWNWGN